MSIEDNTIESLADDVDVASPDGVEAVGDADSGTTNDSEALDPNKFITLEEIENTLGKKFNDKDSALKAWKDTNSFVGKRYEKAVEEARAKLDPAVRAKLDELDQLKAQMGDFSKKSFYQENPQYKGMEKLINKMGDNPADVVQSEDFKEIFAKVQVGEKAQEADNVLESNPRITETRNKMQKANEALAQGNYKGAVDNVLEGVMETLG